MIKKLFYCKNCDEKFQIEVLTLDEKQELIKLRKPARPAVCPYCRSGNIIEI